MSDSLALIDRILGKRVMQWFATAILLLLTIIVCFVIGGRVFLFGPWAVGFSQPSHDVPVGTVISFWGALDGIPKGFELCDGRQVATEGSPILGMDKPDLRDGFVKGAQSTVTDTRINPETGGSNQVSLNHSHPAGSLFALITQKAVSGNNFNVPHVTRGSFSPNNGGFGMTGGTMSAEASGRWSGREDLETPPGTAIEGSTADASLSFDNRPKFVALYMIIKVR